MTKLKPVTNQTTLSIIEKLRSDRERLKAELEQINSMLEPLENDAIAYIENGGTPILDYFMSIEVSTRVIPKWKQEYIDALGETAAKAVQDRTPPTTYKKLIITPRR